jgi:hypothetical protein
MYDWGISNVPEAIITGGTVGVGLGVSVGAGVADGTGVSVGGGMGVASTVHANMESKTEEMATRVLLRTLFTNASR